ncbi:MAG TPA: methyltransferase domain-containing protein [Acidimicrobiales bacterium]
MTDDPVPADVAQEANREWWDRAVPVHLASEFYDVDGWLSGDRGPRSHEVAVLGDVTGLDLVHLQCHFGKDTLGWARAGATVTGLDFSPSAVEAARDLAVQAGLSDRADFVCAPVADAVATLGGRDFDIVYVSLGALWWLPSVDEWAGQVAGLLRPGGRLFVHDAHPVSLALADADLTLATTYFEEVDPYADSEPGSYADPTATEALPGRPTFGWNHGLGEIIGSLVSWGLRIDRLDEHDWTSFRRFPWLVETAEEQFVVPEGHLRVPLSFTLVASKA